MRSLRLSFLLLACLLFPPTLLAQSEADPDAAAQLRVMSFNIRYGTAKDGDNRWELRRELVAETIRDYKPHLLGLQEALDFQIEYLLQQLPGYSMVGVSRQGGEAGEYSCIFVDDARMEVERSGTFWLSETPEVAASKGWDAALPRICTWAELHDRATDSRFVHLNAHYDHVGAKAREEGGRLINKRSREFVGLPVIVTGDFNAAEGSAPMLATQGETLVDSFRVLHPDLKPAGTFNSFRGKQDGAKIDYLLTSEHWRVHAAGIDYRERDGRTPSDHYPVTATLGLPRSPSESLLGRYRRQPVENDWHEGSITRDAGGILRWTNDAGATWTLELDEAGEKLITGPRNPYAKDGRDSFDLVLAEQKVVGFRFGQETYVREGVTLATQRSGGLKGYISTRIETPPDGFGYGSSYYISVWSLLDEPLAGFQIGLPSTWIIPDNRDFEEPLCPPGTVARDNWPERGPTWSDVFQTIEGGLGFWVSTRFPSAVPKYRMNGTPNGYNHEISSPGWGFGRIGALAQAETGIAQLSNRMLVPPDGLTFPTGTASGLLGNAWMSLPLVPEQVVEGTPTGSQCWTLFFNSANFRGPLAFWIPGTWSELSKGYHTIHGRGLDARPGFMGGGAAMEFNTVPYFAATDSEGVEYTRIPRIHFPTDSEGRTLMMQDVLLYSREALHDSIASWFHESHELAGGFNPSGGFRPKITSNPLRFRQGPQDVPMVSFDESVTTTIYELEDSQAFGLSWEGKGQAHSLPEYWKRVGQQLVPVAASDVPRSTGLHDQGFARPNRFPAYTAPTSEEQVWSVSHPSLGPFEADLSDGSRVTYAWFRFIDQPSLRDVAWTEATRNKLQAFVEEVHRSWPIDGSYLPAPSTGELVSFDEAQLVTPPAGFEIGYVPIALGQVKLTGD